MIELQAAEITLEKGVENDFRGKPGKRQVTLLSAERWAEACQAVGETLPWTTRRANLLVEGIDFDALEGQQLRVGQAILQVNGECEPCSRMDEAKAGLQKAMKPRLRAGLLATVLVPGNIKVGDKAELYNM